MTRSIPQEPTTPFPSRLIDDVMPGLTDTEFRVLVVIVRQTRGWMAGGGKRKEWEWLSHAQLKARTGRASAAISRAIDGLVGRGLIEVATPTGIPLATAQARRASQDRMLFRLRNMQRFPEA